MVKMMSRSKPDLALRMGTISAAVIFITGSYSVIDALGIHINIWWSVIAGAVGGIIIGLVTEYYTASKPVKQIARAGETGSATVMITGLSVGMQSVVLPMLTICGIIYVSTSLSGCMVSGLRLLAC